MRTFMIAAIIAVLAVPAHAQMGQGKGGGRPNSNKKPPKASQKGGAGGEPRTTVKTS